MYSLFSGKMMMGLKAISELKEHNSGFNGTKKRSGGSAFDSKDSSPRLKRTKRGYKRRK